MQKSTLHGHTRPGWRRWRVGVSLYRLASAFGLDPLRMARGLRGLPRFVRAAIEYSRLETGADRFRLSLAQLYPCLCDWNEAAGDVGSQYFWQDLWAARRIYRARPSRHVDIGSRIDGFVAHLLSFMPVTVVDIRPLPLAVEGLTFVRADATTLREFADSSLDSVSSLCAVEHFGLGRYGDPVDPQAPFKVMSALQRVVRPGGALYLGLPIGRERLEFNSHRVFAPATVSQAFSRLRLVSFAAVDDAGHYLTDVEPGSFAEAHCACGLFEFAK